MTRRRSDGETANAAAESPPTTEDKNSAHLADDRLAAFAEFLKKPPGFAEMWKLMAERREIQEETARWDHDSFANPLEQEARERIRAKLRERSTEIELRIATIERFGAGPDLSETLTTPEIAVALAGLYGSAGEWKARLRAAPKWLLPALVQRQERPRPNFWSPVLLAEALCAKGKLPRYEAAHAFRTRPELVPFLPAWEAHEAERRESEGN